MLTANMSAALTHRHPDIALNYLDSEVRSRST
jgi:hypothetical protein